MLTRVAIVAEARSWIGTHYRHQQSLKGVGCDCLGLLRGVWRAVYGQEPEPTPLSLALVTVNVAAPAETAITSNNAASRRRFGEPTLNDIFNMQMADLPIVTPGRQAASCVVNRFYV